MPTEGGDELHDAHQDCREILIDGVALGLPEDGLEAEDDGVDAGPLLERLKSHHQEKRLEDRATEQVIKQGSPRAENKSKCFINDDAVLSSLLRIDLHTFHAFCHCHLAVQPSNFLS